jgi:hypothetical protein
MSITNGHNVQQRASVRGGWIGIMTGESMGSALERTTNELNARGYRVAFIVPDQWSLARRVLNVLLFTVTAGFIAHSPGVLVVGERCS